MPARKNLTQKMNSKPNPKSALWNQIKAIGNPDSVKWTATQGTMEWSLRQQAKRVHAESVGVPVIKSAAPTTFAPVKKVVVEDDVDSEDEKIEQQIEAEQEKKPAIVYGYVSDLMNNALSKVTLGSFPVEYGWGNIDPNTGRPEHYYLATDADILKNQIDAIMGQTSDFKDEEVDVSTFFFTPNFIKNHVPKNTDGTAKTPINKSKTGQGNDFKTCTVVDNEFVYIPESKMCLLMCLNGGKPLDEIMLKRIQKFLKSKKIFRYNIPSCNVRDIAEIMGVKFNIYTDKNGGVIYKKEEGQIILYLLDSHWIVLKNGKKYVDAVKYAKENITWSDRRIVDCGFETQLLKPKYHSCVENQAYEDTYIQDFETYGERTYGKIDKDKEDSKENTQLLNTQFHVYASGFTKLSQMKTFLDGKYGKMFQKPQDLVEQTEGPDCAIKMLKKIDSRTKQVSTDRKGKDGKVMVDKNGKPLKNWQKRNVYIYAHNGAKFDSYYYINIPGVKCISMIEKGGIMALTIGGEIFKNCNFVIRDSMKFLKDKQIKLCESFQLDKEYWKSEMDHGTVDAENWESLRHVWKPYLDLDVVSLSMIWIKFIAKMRLASKDLDVKKYCSIAQLSYSVACKDQQLPCFTDPKLRQFIQFSIKGGRVQARKQGFSTKELAKILEVNEASSIDDLVGKKLSQESIDLIDGDYQISFDATSLYPSAMYLPHASYLDAENTFALTSDQCATFNPQEWTTKKFIIECDLYAPKDLQFVPLAFKTEFGAQFSTGNLRNMVINDVDLFECFRFGYELKKVYQGIWSEPIKFQFMKDFVTTFFNERAKVKNTDKVLGDLYKLMLNSAYGKFGEKRIETETKFTTEKELDEQDKYTQDVIPSSMVKLGNGQICYKQKKAQKEGDKLSPHHIQSYILSYSKQIMNNFVLLIGADKENLISYMDTDSFYIHVKDYNKLAHIKDELGGGKNDYGDSQVIIKGDYLGCKSKVCYVLDLKTRVLNKKVTWKGISEHKFGEIGQDKIQGVKSKVNLGKDKADQIKEEYMLAIDNWKQNKLTGNSIDHGCKKKLSISVYCQKYLLDDGVYHYKHIE